MAKFRVPQMFTYALPAICRRNGCLEVVGHGHRFCEQHKKGRGGSRIVVSQSGDREPTNMWVYFIGPEDRTSVKIGRTKGAVTSRLAALQCGSPVLLTIFAAVPIREPNTETSLHKRLSEYRLHGEWFEYAAEVRLALQAALEGTEALEKWLTE